MRGVQCGACGAPAVVSAVEVSPKCAHCGAPITLPPDVAAHAAATRAVLEKVSADARTLDAAEAVLVGGEKSRLVFVVVLLLLSCGGFETFAAVWAAIDKGAEAFPDRIVPPLFGLAAAVAVAVGALSLQRWAKKSLFRAFAAGAPTPGAPDGTCHVCGGPLAGSAGRGTVRCRYCGTDNLVGKSEVVRVAAEAAVSLAAHADGMLTAFKRFMWITRGLGFVLLVVFPVVVLGVHMSLSAILAETAPPKTRRVRLASSALHRNRT